MLVPNEHPPEASRRGLDDIPRVERIEDCVPETSVSPRRSGESSRRAILEAVAAAGVGGGAVD